MTAKLAGVITPLIEYNRLRKEFPGFNPTGSVFKLRHVIKTGVFRYNINGCKINIVSYVTNKEA